MGRLNVGPRILVPKPGNHFPPLCVRLRNFDSVLVSESLRPFLEGSVTGSCRVFRPGVKRCERGPQSTAEP